jgi:hypothetical protein
MTEFGIGWFLSVAWLILVVQVTENCRLSVEDRKRVQGIMIALWVIFGLVPLIFLR